MRKTYDEMESDSKSKHISGMKPIINRALSVNMQDNKELVLQLLDEALVNDNPLSVFGSLRLFSRIEHDAEEYEDIDFGSVISATEVYEKWAQRTVLTCPFK